MWAPHTGPPVSFRRLASRAAKPRGQFRAESEVFRLCKTLSRSPEPVRDFEALWPVGLFRFVSVRSTCSLYSRFAAKGLVPAEWPTWVVVGPIRASL